MAKTNNQDIDYLIALGSNQGNRAKFLRAATMAIGRRCGTVLTSAKPVVTAPVGAADAEFLNSTLICRSQLKPLAMLTVLLEIEATLGRIRTVHWGNRTIDLDIILARSVDGQGMVWESPLLVVPHPRAAERSFVLVPAAEIAGDWLHPIKNKTIAELRDLLTWQVGDRQPSPQPFFESNQESNLSFQPYNDQ